MIGLILRWLTSAAAIWLTSLLFSGIHVSGMVSLLFASLTLAVLNALVRPLLLLVTLPLTVVTLGLFVFVVNAVVLKLAAFFVPGFDVIGFWTAVFGAIVLSFVNMILSSLLRDRDQVEYIYIEHRQG
jgi:putative membrane protein